MTIASEFVLTLLLHLAKFCTQIKRKLYIYNSIAIASILQKLIAVNLFLQRELLLILLLAVSYIHITTLKSLLLN